MAREKSEVVKHLVSSQPSAVARPHLLAPILSPASFSAPVPVEPSPHRRNPVARRHASWAHLPSPGLAAPPEHCQRVSRYVLSPVDASGRLDDLIHMRLAIIQPFFVRGIEGRAIASMAPRASAISRLVRRPMCPWPREVEGTFVGSVGARGAEVGQFNFPAGIALTPNERHVLVVDQVLCFTHSCSMYLHPSRHCSFFLSV
jgi:hypothetical protein